MLKISIIIPCYNQGQYLDETLQSVLEQTYSNWECIIVNDSPDETEIISQKWAAKDPRFNYLYKKMVV
jgi:glycosyltransferase involved in cell wall biosynthesis